MTALGCFYSNHPFDTEKNICMHTSPPTTHPPTHPSPLPPLSPTSSFLPSFLSFFLLSFPFFFNSIHSFIHCLSLLTTYLPHFSPPPPFLISRTHTPIYISPSHTPISTYHCHFFSFPFHFSLPLLNEFLNCKRRERNHFTLLHFTPLHFTTFHFNLILLIFPFQLFECK